MQTRISDLPTEMQVDGIETRGMAVDDITIRHIDLPPGVDFTPLFKGLPGDLCQCPHWGQIAEGSITIQYADGSEETASAGDLYHWPAGHTGWTDEGVVFIEFSPTEAITPVLQHLAAQMSPAT